MFARNSSEMVLQQAQSLAQRQIHELTKTQAKQFEALSKELAQKQEQQFAMLTKQYQDLAAQNKDLIELVQKQQSDIARLRAELDQAREMFSESSTDTNSPKRGISRNSSRVDAKCIVS